MPSPCSQCTVFDLQAFASIFGKGSKRKEFKEEYAKVLAMEIYALLMTANGDLVEYTLEEVKVYFVPL